MRGGIRKAHTRPQILDHECDVMQIERINEAFQIGHLGRQIIGNIRSFGPSETHEIEGDHTPGGFNNGHHVAPNV